MSLALVVGAAGAILGIELLRQNVEFQDRLAELAHRLQKSKLIALFTGPKTSDSVALDIDQSKKGKGLEGVVDIYNSENILNTQKKSTSVLNTVAWTTLCVGAGVYIGQQKYGRYAYRSTCRAVKTLLGITGHGASRVHAYCVDKSSMFKWTSSKIQGYVILASQQILHYWQKAGRIAEGMPVLPLMKWHCSNEDNIDDLSDGDETNDIDEECTQRLETEARCRDPQDDV